MTQQVLWDSMPTQSETILAMPRDTINLPLSFGISVK
jgi:hypothetical protein